MSENTDHEPDDDPERDPERTLARFRHPLAWLGWLVPFAPFVILAVAIHHNQQGHLHENAAELCARAPACEGDIVDIAYANKPRLQRSRGMGSLVLYQRSSDCTHTIESYHYFTGGLMFRGSPDDPDPAARAEFLAKRSQWSSQYVIRERVACSHSDEL